MHFWSKISSIPFVPKKFNPANLPKARPIEDFWGIMKAKVLQDNWSAKNIDQLKKKIRKCLLDIFYCFVKDEKINKFK